MSDYISSEFNNNYSDDELSEADGAAPDSSLGHPDKERIKELLLDCLRSGASVTTALKTINGPDAFGSPTARVGRKTIYSWRKYDVDFRRAWDEAYAEGTDLIEERVNELALAGNATLLVFSLKIRNPARYSVTRQEISGPNGKPLDSHPSLDLSYLTLEERAFLRQMLEKRDLAAPAGVSPDRG